MRAVVALLIVAIAALTLSQSAWAVNLDSPDVRYRAMALTGEQSGTVGFGSSPVEAVANAMRKCLEYTDDCTAGVAAPWEWNHLLVHCPEIKVNGVDLFTIAAFSPKQDQMVISEIVLAWLGKDYINFNCFVIGGDYEGQPVLAWMITTH